MIIFLVGYMGSGKSKTGPALARKLSYDFIDTDQLVESEQGRTIPEIFDSEGEQYFRKLESNALRSLNGKQKLVVATGGGLPCFDDNMDWINKHGLSVYLKLPAGMLVQRLQSSPVVRPLLKGLTKNELLDKVQLQLKEREEFYSRAQIIFNAADSDLKLLLKEISVKTDSIR